MSLIQVESLSIRYRDQAVVENVSFEINHGESVGLVGESGSGKTQTALAVLGLLPDAADVSGSIRLSDRELVGASEADLDTVRAARIAMVFQDPAQALNPYRTIGEQFRHILLAHSDADEAQADEKIIAMLARVGLPDPKRQFNAYPHELSGGMRQRAMIAAALVTEPDLLIADEPTTALDVTVQAQILELLETLRDDTALLLITHDLGVVAGHCERMLVMSDGKLVEAGRTGDLFRSPAHEQTQKMIANAPRLDQDAKLSTPADEVLLEIDKASVSYRERGSGEVHAVRDASSTIRRGETLAIVGESGSGKTSLARAVLGLVPTSAGRIVYCGDPLRDDLNERPSSVRRDLQLVFQDPAGSLNPQHRVRTLVGEPLHVHERSLAADARQVRIVTALEQVGLDESFLDRLPHQLSGGQAQRVAIARALILEPRVLICDEAVAALDGSVQRQILELLVGVQKDTGLSILFISHDLAVVRAISHRVMVMYMGRQVELGETQSVLDAPQHPYTQALLAAVPVPDPFSPTGSVSVTGEAPSMLSPPDGCAFHTRCPFADSFCETTRPSLRELGGSQVACHHAESLQQKN